MRDPEKVTTLDTTPTIVAGLISERHAAGGRAQASALAYMVDTDAQERKLRNGYKRRIERALQDGDTDALTAFVKQAQAAGIKFEF